MLDSSEISGDTLALINPVTPEIAPKTVFIASETMDAIPENTGATSCPNGCTAWLTISPKSSKMPPTCDMPPFRESKNVVAACVPLSPNTPPMVSIIAGSAVTKDSAIFAGSSSAIVSPIRAIAGTTLTATAPNASSRLSVTPDKSIVLPPSPIAVRKLSHAPVSIAREPESVVKDSCSVFFAKPISATPFLSMLDTAS